PDALDVYSVGEVIEEKYKQLWKQINESIGIKRNENYKIQERIRKLNEIGFSVDEIVFFPTSKQDEVQFKTIVTDKNYYQNLLHLITGFTARENQARHIINEIQEIKANLSRKFNSSLTLGAAAFHWKKNNYETYIQRLREHFNYLADPVENYCQILEHKWFLSEKAQRDVGLDCFRRLS
ncbi:MAG: DUF4032 domain-containing protein, partial [Candidatus Hodarchaeales archaeon]